MKNSLIILMILYGLSSCSDNPLNREWSIPVDDIDSGLNQNDAIPSIDFPEFLSIGSVDFMDDNDQIFIVAFGNEIKGYPTKILEWHQIVNDITASNDPVAIAHSTLSGMNLAWNRTIGSRELSFGNSRYLYKNNQIFYDRETLNYWSMILGKSISGNVIEEALSTYPSIEMNWKACKLHFPNAQILSTETGFIRDYNEYPYTDYSSDNSDFVFDPDTLDQSQINAKEIILGLEVGSNQKAYRFGSFGNQGIELIEDNLDNEDLLIIGNRADNFLHAFRRPMGVTFSESTSPDNLLFFNDNLGNKYNPLGKVISGPDIGTQLEMANYKLGYWFIWKDYFPSIKVY